MKGVCSLVILLLASTAFALSDKEIKEAYEKSYRYEKSQNYEDAIKALLPVLKDYPDTYTVNARLGWLYYLNKKYANSLENYTKAMKTSPESLEAKLGYILPLLAQDRYQQAEEEAYKILKVDHFNYYGNMRFAFALRMQKKYNEAEKINVKMLALYPIDVSFLTEYALTKHGQGDTKKAVEVFYNVLILDPENVTAKNFLRK
jgi:tetratricopeptide (TPR) repeat protein